MKSNSLIIGHWLNIVAWICLLLSILAFAAVGKPASVGAVFAMFLFVRCIVCYNAAAREGEGQPMNRPLTKS